MIISVSAIKIIKIIDGEDENNSFKDVFLMCLLQICYTEAILITHIRILLITIASVWKT